MKQVAQDNSKAQSSSRKSDWQPEIRLVPNPAESNREDNARRLLASLIAQSIHSGEKTVPGCSPGDRGTEGGAISTGGASD